MDPVPDQFVKRALRASDSVTTARLTTDGEPKARPVTATRCAVSAAFVTFTAHDASAPGLPVKFSWFADRPRAPPACARPRPVCHAASLTARRLLSRPAPCSVAGAPRSVAVDSRMRLTIAGVGGAPRCAVR